MKMNNIYLALLFSSSLLVSTVLAQEQPIELPDMGLSADAIMSPQEERFLGQQFLRGLRKENQLLEDPLVDGYLASLGQYLASFSNQSDQNFTFFTIPSSVINAFAVPGGYIGINSGLFLRTETEAELASVLAHEIAHVTQRHAVRREEAMQSFSVPMLIASLLGLAAASAAGEGDAAQAAVIASNALSIQQFLDYTRIHEQEADYLGMQILAHAGFDPRGMPKFFEELQAASRYRAGEVPEFLRTHPVTSNRIADSYSRAEQYSVQTPRSENDLFYLMRARLLVLTHDKPNQLLIQLEEALETNNFRTEKAVHYALALTYLRLEQPLAAKSHLTWLMQNDVDRVPYRLLSIDIARQSEAMPEAIAAAKAALKLYPSDYILSFTYAQLLLQLGQADAAEKVLQTLKDKDKMPPYYRLLADVYSQLNQLVMAHLTLAEFHYLKGDTEMAITQLEQAQRMTSSEDYYLSARVDDRLKKMRLALRKERKYLKDRE